MVDKKLQHEPRYRTQFPRKGKQWNRRVTLVTNTIYLPKYRCLLPLFIVNVKVLIYVLSVMLLQLYL
jgi:hypothetical protein